VNTTTTMQEKLSALGNKVERFCVITKLFSRLLIIPKHDGSCIQTIAIMGTAN